MFEREVMKKIYGQSNPAKIVGWEMSERLTDFETRHCGAEIKVGLRLGDAH